MYFPNATGLTALLCAALLALPLSAQPAREANDVPAVRTHQGDLTFYAARAAFDAAFPGLPLEDFQDVNVGLSHQFCSSPSPVDSMTDDECYDPGTIMAPIAIAAQGPFENEPDAILALGSLYHGSIVVGGAYFMDDTELHFDGGVDAVGFDMYGYATVVVEVYDTLENFLGSTTVVAADDDIPYFVGVSAPVAIGRILLNDDNVINSTMKADNIAFMVSDDGGAVVTEAGDAGDVVTDPAQDATGRAVELITGTVGAADDEDCFALTVTDAALFDAEVDSFDPDGDSQLFLFSAADATGVFGDDDGGDGGLSHVTSADFLAGGGTEGDYYLCVSAFNDDPRNAAGQRIFSFGSTTADPPNGDARLAAWDDAGALSAPSEYAIRIRGVDGADGPDFSLTASLSTTTPAPGETFEIDFEACNHTDAPADLDLFYGVSDAGGNEIRGDRFGSGTVQANACSGMRTVRQRVPTNAPGGTYAYCLKLGEFPDAVEAQRCFDLTVTGSVPRQIAALAEARRLAEVTGNKRPVLAAEAVLGGLDYGAWAAPRELPRHAAPPAPPLAGASTATAPMTVAPNPFARQATIRYEVAEASDVRLVVYDVLGREVAVLVDGPQEAGAHFAQLDAAKLPSGSYHVRLTAGEVRQTQRLTVAH